VDGAGGEEPTSAAIRRRIIQFARLAAEDDTILFFFSGHGVTREGQGYIVPLDGDAMTGIALDWVKETLLSSKAASKIMVLDACHAGSSAKGVAGIAPSLVGGSGLTMLLSSRADEVSYPDASGMSVFTKYLVEGISGPADSDGDALVTGAELFAYVSDGMKGWCVRTGKTQVPLSFGDAARDAVLARLKTAREIRAEKAVLEERIKALEAPREDLSADIRAAEEAELARLRSRLAELESPEEPGERLLAMADTVLALADKRSELLKIYTSRSSVVRKVEAELHEKGPAAIHALEGRISEIDSAYRRLLEEYRPEHPEMKRLADEKARLQTALIVVGTSLPAGVFKESAVSPLVPAGFRAAPGSTFEPYTGTCWASAVIHEKSGIEMVFIPAGEFMRGSPSGESGRHDYEGPQHRVRITKPFYLGKYEVTQGEWQRVMGSNPSYFKGDRNPVENVSWNDCQTFLSKAGDGLRLPTEAQWEYACRAGTTSRFSFDESDSQLGEYGWYEENSAGRTHPVGGKRPNAWGLYDMHGNVREWCGDWYDSGYYARSPGSDPQGPSSGTSRVFRGGSWCSEPEECRSAYRLGSTPDYAFSSVGLRVAAGLD